MTHSSGLLIQLLMRIVSHHESLFGQMIHYCDSFYKRCIERKVNDYFPKVQNQPDICRIILKTFS